MKIRSATSNDVREILDLERNTPGAAHWSEEQYGTLFHTNAVTRLTLVAEEAGVILGFLIARPAECEWEIENIAVDIGLQRRGLGSSLLSELLARARLEAATAVILEVRESNVAARALYQSLGFVAEGGRKDYYRQPDEDAILYRLPLR